MEKLTLVLVITIVAAALALVSGLPTREDDISAAVAASRWDEVQRILKEHAKEAFNWSPVLSADVKSLKPVPGGHVYGESEFTFHSSSNINGKTNEESGGHRVINNDGTVTEYYFKP